MKPNKINGFVHKSYGTALNFFSERYAVYPEVVKQCSARACGPGKLSRGADKRYLVVCSCIHCASAWEGATKTPVPGVFNASGWAHLWISQWPSAKENEEALLW